MRTIETEALVLKSFSLAEADKIVVFLTRDKGLVRGVAKGARRLKSRFGSSLEPLTSVYLSYVQKEDRELVSIKNCELQKSHFQKISDSEFFRQFIYLGELLGEFAPPAEPNERLFKMAKICFETSADNPGHLDVLILYFELWILKLSGYLPSWEHCHECKRKLNESEKTVLQTNFHLVCQNCQRGGHAWMVSAEQRMIFTSSQKLSPLRFVETVRERTTSIRELSIICKRLISSVLGKDVFEKNIKSAGL